VGQGGPGLSARRASVLNSLAQPSPRQSRLLLSSAHLFHMLAVETEALTP
jgi:hypothetical protein